MGITVLVSVLHFFPTLQILKNSVSCHFESKLCLDLEVGSIVWMLWCHVGLCVSLGCHRMQALTFWNVDIKEGWCLSTGWCIAALIWMNGKLAGVPSVSQLLQSTMWICLGVSDLPRASCSYGCRSSHRWWVWQHRPQNEDHVSKACSPLQLPLNQEGQILILHWCNSPFEWIFICI